MRMHIGLATADITPHASLELSGWCFGKSVGTHDPLMATCGVFEDGNGKVVLMSTDLIGMGVELACSLRQQIAERLGTTRDRVCICCTHTHSGPATVFLRKWGEIDPAYIEFLRERVIACATAADSDLFQGDVVTVRKNVWGIGYNRRRTNGPVDPELLITRIHEAATGQLRGFLLNYACHPVILHGYKNLFSADYPGCVRARIMDRIGHDLPVIFVTGTCGNINPYGTDVGHGNLEGADRIGRLLGDAVVESGADVASGSPSAGESAAEQGRVDACESTVHLSVYPPPPREELERLIEQRLQALEEAESGRALARHAERVSHQIEVEWARDVLRDLEEGKAPHPVEVVLQVLTIGDLMAVGISAEVFVEIGMAIKNRWYAEREAGPHLCVMTLANGDIGYIPDSASFSVATYEAGGLAYKVYGKHLIESDSGDRVITRLLDYPKWMR